jgi:hypothetical protein
MYWAWSIQCDMQLTLLVPLFVQLFQINSKAAHGLMILLVIISMVINASIIGFYQLKVGVLAIENM